MCCEVRVRVLRGWSSCVVRPEFVCCEGGVRVFCEVGVCMLRGQSSGVRSFCVARLEFVCCEVAVYVL